jgi:hypothetical protein
MRESSGGVQWIGFSAVASHGTKSPYGHPIEDQEAMRVS